MQEIDSKRPCARTSKNTAKPFLFNWILLDYFQLFGSSLKFLTKILLQLLVSPNTIWNTTTRQQSQESQLSLTTQCNATANITWFILCDTGIMDNQTCCTRTSSTDPCSNDDDGPGVIAQYWTNCAEYVVIAKWITVAFCNVTDIISINQLYLSKKIR